MTSWITSSPVHPRRRGERNVLDDGAGNTTGSSPQARGTPPNWYNRRPSRRFIPAGAGNATPPEPPVAARPVHPRRRGERGYGLAGNVVGFGSSPQARGTRRARGAVRDAHRFIPAGAGNARQPGVPVCFQPVHPRRRGERCVEMTVTLPPHGSSPQARGTPYTDSAAVVMDRFIPAGAGNASTGR